MDAIDLKSADVPFWHFWHSWQTPNSFRSESHHTDFGVMQSEIFKALEKTKLLVGDKKKSQYSRCGRTDKGVSSFGQVSSKTATPLLSFLMDR